MLLYVNDRFLRPGQRLRLLAVAPQLGAPEPAAGVPPPELHATFRLLDEVGQVIPVEWTRPEHTFNHLRTPYSCAELQTARLEPGAYTVQALSGSETIGVRDFVLLDTPQWEALADGVAGDASATGPMLEGNEMFVDVWQRSWNDLYSYLDVPLPAHIHVTSGSPAGSRSYPPVPLESFGWVTFHLARFALDHVFYGGVVALEPPVGDETAAFRIVMLYRVTPVEGREDGWLDDFRLLLRDQQFRLDFQLNERPTPPGFAGSRSLDVTLSLPLA